MTLAAHGRNGDFHAGKRAAARYFFRRELPKVRAQLDLLASADTTTLEMRDAWFRAPRSTNDGDAARADARALRADRAGASRCRIDAVSMRDDVARGERRA